MTDTPAANGRCYEDFNVGMLIRHPLGRTVTPTDNAWSTLLAGNTNPIHFDAHYSLQTEFGRPLVNSPFILALVTGLSVADISRYGVNLGWDEVRMPSPVFEGDTIYAQSEIVMKRESKSRPHMGIIEVKTTGFKHDGTVIMTFRRSILVYKRDHVPIVPMPQPAT
ncbi:MAG TPA: MaoC family dehydratase [Gemmatimonadaceae bacterium]|jgi:acyl dehydratase|nr:MaoC family dehydratase [Gemmatimonadaceae bacterium]